MDERLKPILNKLHRTRRGETVCLMSWEVELLLNLIDELQRGQKDGTSEV